MTANVIIFLIIFGTIFGIVYIGVAARTRVRLALIEKGADASIFNTKSHGGGNVLPIVLVNLALLLFSIGIAIFLAAIMDQYLNIQADITYPGTIFTLAGLALYAGYRISSRILSKAQD